MLGQPGSTPLDLFKFYVKDLRDKLPTEKKLVKELLKEKEIEITPEMTYDDFVGEISSIKVHKLKKIIWKIFLQNFQSQIDGGNLRMIFASLQERAEQLAIKKVFCPCSGTRCSDTFFSKPPHIKTRSDWGRNLSKWVSQLFFEFYNKNQI